MKKFFQGGSGGGVGVVGGVEPSTSTPPPRKAVNYNRLSTALPDSLPVPIASSMLVAPIVAASTPRTPLSPYTASSPQQYFDIQRAATISPSPSSTVMLGSGVLASVQNLAPPPVSPGAVNQIPDSNNSLTNMQGHTVEHNDLHKGLKSLETLLASFDEYRDMKSKLAKSEKKLAKSLSELSKSKMLEEIPTQTLQMSALLFDSITDTTSKHAKLIQKEYESLNEHCGKYFKKVAKEEKVHEELLDTLDSKIKRAHAGHEKNVKKSGRVAMDSHDRYIQTVQGLTQEVNRAKASHNASVGNKTFITSLFVASTLGGVADCEFKALCESVRKSGPHVGKLNEWLNFASTEGMANVQPIDLNEDAMGWAQVLAIKEAEIREEMVKQEQEKFALLEQAQALLKAKQMGWTPPTVLAKNPQRPNSSLSNMSRLDHRGEVMERPPVPQTAPRIEMHLPSPLMTENQEVSPQQVKKPDEEIHSQQSSLADGTIIDRGDVIDESVKLSSSPMRSTSSRDSSDAMPSSLTDSISKDSEESTSLTSRSVSRSTGPPTPKDEIKDIVIVKGVPERMEGILKKADMAVEVEYKVERPADRYVDVHALGQKNDVNLVRRRSISIGERTRRHSLWDYEQDRERQLDRAVELPRRPVEAEDRIRTVNTNGQQPKVNPPRPRYSEPSRSYQQTRHDEEIPAQRYEPERHAPSDGINRIVSGGVNRTMSTDSERSFVIKMKAKYQEEKAKAARPVSMTVRSGGSGGNKMYAADSSPSRMVEEPRIPHTANCGCSSCTARLYSPPAVKALLHSPPPVPPLPLHYSASPRGPSHRRLSIPVVRDDRRNTSILISTLPPPPRQLVRKQSLEGVGDRRVMFSNDYQKVR